MAFKTAKNGSPDFDKIADEFVAALRGGKSPTVKSFSQKYPAFASAIDVHFPGLLFAEKMRGTSQYSRLRLPSGYRFGKYQIDEEIGRGGMGVVYNAIRADLESEFAIKVISVEDGSTGGRGCDRQRLMRFQREAQIVAKIHHPNIIPLIDFGCEDGLLFLVMRKIVGVTFSDLFLSSGASGDVSQIKNDWRLLAILFHEIAKTLSYIHENGLLHQDVKPCNLMLDESSRVWLADFGLARLAESSLEQQESNHPIGTVGYIAPELATGPGDVRSDVYSLGVTMFEVLTGIQAKEIQLHQRLTGKHFALPDPRELNSKIPNKLARIVMKAVQESVADRYQTARNLAKELDDFARKRPFLSRVLDWKR